MGFFRKSKRGDSSHYDVTSDPGMTRFEERYCDDCGTLTMHKISRNYQGASDATITCTSCRKWRECSW